MKIEWRLDKDDGVGYCWVASNEMAAEPKIGELVVFAEYVGDKVCRVVKTKTVVHKRENILIVFTKENK